MIRLKDEIRNTLAARFQVKPEELNYLSGGREDNDGIVYTYEKSGKRYVMKIVAMDDEKMVLRAQQKLEFARYLGDCGIPTAYPKEDEEGNIFHSIKEDKHIFLASIMDFIEGSCPKTEELTDTIVSDWGRLTGKMNRFTKQYKVWKNLDDTRDILGYEDEIDGFYRWCRNDLVKQKWLDIKKEMSQFEVNRDTFGLIHNDNHQNNIIVGKKGITLIDYDCSECQFIAQDIFVPIQGMLFDRAGGIERPITDPDCIKRFYDHFLSGYEMENHMEDIWLGRMETFLNYRRLLLYTVMQDWMESDPNVGNAFIHMIENPVPYSVI